MLFGPLFSTGLRELFEADSFCPLSWEKAAMAGDFGVEKFFYFMDFFC